MESKIPWIRFQKTFGYGTARGQKILDRFGGRPEKLFGEPMKNLAATGMFRPVELKNMTTAGSEESAWRVLDLCEDNGCQVLTPDDPDYPVNLRQISGFPAVLYVRGSLAGLDESLSIAMVGTRRPTEYGIKAADAIAGALSEKGAVIVSGLAKGIDTASHIAALKAGGRTVAVLGCGIDIVYPAENARLADLILRHGGAVVTEFPPGTQPMRHHFPIRNRIISGLSHGVVIVEGTRRSGSLITANHAYAQSRDVFAVPGSIFSKTSEGPNYLLAQYAKAVDCVESILEEYEYRLHWEPRQTEKINSQKTLSSFEQSEENGYNDGRRSEGKGRPGREEGEKAAPVRQPPGFLSEAQRKVFMALSGEEPRTSDYIAQESGLAAPAVLTALTQLEIFGLVRTHPGKRFSRT